MGGAAPKPFRALTSAAGPSESKDNHGSPPVDTWSRLPAKKAWAGQASGRISASSAASADMAPARRRRSESAVSTVMSAAAASRHWASERTACPVRRPASQSSAKKRFRVRPGGTVKRGQAFKRHILTKKSTTRKRQLRGAVNVHETNMGHMAQMLPFAGL